MKRSALVGAVVLALLASGISLVVTLPLLGKLPGSPIMQAWPTGANNRARAAADLVTDRADHAAISRAGDMARRVLAEEPVNVVAARTLGLIAALGGDARRAAATFRFAELLSRRDKATQIFLIENSVSQGDVAGALLHYDRVLRNSPDLRDMLFPILRGAIGEPDVASQLAVIVARKPLWWSWFIRNLINDPADSSGFLYMTAVRMRPNLARPTERDFLAGTMTRLVNTGQSARARQLYRVATGATAIPPIRDGGFERNPVLAPLDWQFTDDDGFGATREAGNNGTDVLMLNASVSQRGVAARQALLLEPGMYRLTLRAGDIDPLLRVRPVIRIACQPGGRDLIAFELRATGTGQSLASPPFAVPTGCAVQWLTVELDAAEPAMGDRATPWIDDVAITGAGAGPRDRAPAT